MDSQGKVLVVPPELHRQNREYNLKKKGLGGKIMNLLF